MQREIKFRGYNEILKCFIYGDLMRKGNEWLIIKNSWVDSYITCKVLPKSVGQLTGLKDKNGKDIYEGDILTPNSICRDSNKYIIEWDKKHGCFTSIAGGLNKYIGDIDEEIQYSLLSNMKLDVCKIIGNVFENSELLGEEKK